MSNRFRCPSCHELGSLWEGVDVPGWRSVDEYLQPLDEHGTDWHIAIADGSVGCACGWEGWSKDLEEVGADDKPLVEVHPDQTSIESV